MVQIEVHGMAVNLRQTDVPRELEGPCVGDGALGASIGRCPRIMPFRLGRSDERLGMIESKGPITNGL